MDKRTMQAVSAISQAAAVLMQCESGTKEDVEYFQCGGDVVGVNRRQGSVWVVRQAQQQSSRPANSAGESAEAAARRRRARSVDLRVV